MMSLIVTFLAVLLGVILFLGIIAFVIYMKIKSTAQELGINAKNIRQIKNEMSRIQEEESHRTRNVSGMTKLLLPKIIKDFPEFNENRIYNLCEDNLRVIFNSITKKDKSNLDKVPLLRDSLSRMIDDCKENNIDIEYSDIRFHDFSIKEYTKIDGVATVTVSTALEYFYKKKNNGKIISDSKYKKQTRYSCKFIYIYDESLVKDYENVLGTNCPNCGAVIKVLGHKYCEYCGTAIKEINLKAWQFSSYDEY